MENNVANNVANNAEQQPEKKSFLVTLALCIFLGFLGGHRFYTKYTGTGIAYVFTAGVCGLCVIWDLIMICAGKYKDHDGQELEGYDKRVGIGLLLFVIAVGIVGVLL